MTIRVSGPDGDIFEFPDGTTDAVMDRALRDHYAQRVDNWQQNAPDWTQPREAPTPPPPPPPVPAWVEEANARSVVDDQLVQGMRRANARASGREPILVIGSEDESYPKEREKYLAANQDQLTPIRTDGFGDVVAARIGQTGLGLEAGLVRAIDATGFFSPEVSAQLQEHAHEAEGIAGNTVEGALTTEDVKDNWGNVIPWAAQELPGSLSTMPLVLNPYSLAALGVSMTGSIAQTRAENDGRDNAEFGDVVSAAPAAVASLALDRFGIDRLTGGMGGNVASRLAQGVLTEGGTEAIQGAIESGGGTIGTERGFDLARTGEEAMFSGILGGIAGGTVRGVVEVATPELRRGTRPVPAGTVEVARESVTITPEDDASPLPNDIIAAGRGALAEVDGARVADGILARNNAPAVGTRVAVTAPNGDTITGTVVDAFESDGSQGIKIARDEGGTYENYFDDIADAGDTITPIERAQAINDGLADRAQTSIAQDAEQRAIAAKTPVVPAAPSTPPAPHVEQVRQPVQSSDAIEAYMRQARAAESGGNDNAANSNSSATGRYQFIESTFKEVYQQEFGVSAAAAETAWDNSRNDPAIQERLMRRLTTDNANSLDRAGIEVTPGSLYLAHFAGIGGALNVFLNPQASALQLLGQGAINANPFLRGMTGDDVVRWAASRMGSEVPDADIALVPPPESERDRENPYDQALADVQEAGARQMEQLQAEPAQTAAPTIEQAEITSPSPEQDAQIAATPEAAQPIVTPDAVGASLPADSIGGEPRIAGDASVAPNPVAQDIPPLENGRGSWVVVDRDTGQAVLETFEADTASRINQDRYEVVTAQQWLGRNNGQQQPVSATSEISNPSATQDAGSAFATSYATNRTNALTDLPEPQLRAIAAELGVKRAGPGGLAGFISRIAAQPNERVQSAAASVLGGESNASAAVSTDQPNAAPPIRSGAMSRPDAVQVSNEGQLAGSGRVEISDTGSLGVRLPSGEFVQTSRAADVNVLNDNDFRNELNVADRIARVAGVSEDRARALASSGSGVAPVASVATPRSPIRTAPAPANDAPTVAITTTGREVPVRYRVVELADLVTSNTAEGAVNPAYPSDLQPRDRSRAASQSQIAEIANKLDPRRLGPTVNAADGAPIISPEGVVESGNGRTIALGQAYTVGGERADAYRQYVEEQGFSTEGMTQPVLVRIREGGMTTQDVQAFTREANQRDTAEMSATEQAASDAAALPASVIDRYRGGDLDSAANRDFVKGFMAAIIPTAEQGGMIGPDGAISQNAIRRIGAALMQRAYGNSQLVARLNEATDSNIKSIGGALSDVSAAWAKLVQAVKDGDIDPRMDITANINEAVAIVDQARREVRPVVDYVTQTDIFSGETVNPLTEAVLRLMYANPNFTRPVSRNKLAERLNWYVDQAMLAQADSGLFGDAPTAQPGEILSAARSKFDGQETDQADIFAQPRTGGAGDGVQPGGTAGAGTGQGVSAEPVAAGSGEVAGNVAVEPVADIGNDVELLSQPEGTATTSPATTIDALTKDLGDRLKAMGIADKVRLRIVEGMVAQTGAQGRFIPFSRAIQVALDAPDNHSFVLHHEALHAFREMGVFSPADWTMLVAAAKRQPGVWKSVQRRYGKQSQSVQEEEAVADLFGLYQTGALEAKGAWGRNLEKLRQLMQTIKSWLGGIGATDERTFRTIMAELADGTAAGRVGQNAGYNAASLRGPRENRVTSREIPREMESRVEDIQNLVDLAGTDPTWKGKVATNFEVFRQKMQDRYYPLKRAQRKIEAVIGQPIPDSMNPYMGEEVMAGRMRDKLERLMSEHIEPLFNAMHESKVSIEELETFAYARHAPERNAQIAKINPEMPDGGSGMTNTQARAIMSRVEKAGRMDTMRDLAARMDAIRNDTVALQVESGLISAETAAEWRSTYKHYVPLRGFKEIDGEGDVARINRSGGGITVRGKETRPAYGRRSEADSPLSYLILQAQEAISRSETNRVAREFADLAKANPDGDFWNVNPVKTKRRKNPTTGLVEEYLDTRLSETEAKYTVTAKIDGKEVHVVMNRNNPAAARLADSMRNLSEQSVSKVVQILGAYNRFQSMVNTSLNPEFIITNAFRDMQTAAVHLAGIEDVDGLAKRAAKHYKSAFKASMYGSFGIKGEQVGVFGKNNADWEQWYREFSEEGGRTGYNHIEDIDGLRKKMEGAFDLIGSKHGTDKRTILKVKRAWNAAGELVDGMNTGVENAVRLASYRAARESGLSKKQSASIAKNITVNFNRRGQFGPVMNAAYLFYNASVQGNVRMMQALYHSPKARKIVAGVAVAGLMNEMLNAMLTGDDDDGESFYDKIPDFEKSRNIIIMHPNGESYSKIPMPYGYNAFWEMGRTAGEVYRRGGDRWQASAANLASTVLDAFNPIGFDYTERTGFETLVSLAAPTILDPWVDLSQNRDYTGRPIMPEPAQYGPTGPDAQQYFPRVADHWRAITDFLTESTGGNVVEPGAIDVSPETLEYLAGTMLGAAGGFADRLVALPGRIEIGDVEANDIPFVRKVVGTPSAGRDRSVFYDRMNEVDERVSQGTDYYEAGMIDNLQVFIQEHERVLTMEPATNEARRLTRATRRDKRASEEALSRGLIDEAQHEANLEILEEQDRQVITAYNRLWNQTLYPDEAETE